MKILSFFLQTFVFVTISLRAYSQNGLALETTTLTYEDGPNQTCNVKYITGSYVNLSALILTDMDSYRTTMNKYNYSLATDGLGYIANNNCSADYYMISKTTGEVTMIYTGQNDITSFRNELRKLYPNIQAHFVDGFEIYATPLKKGGGLVYKLQVYIKEKQTGGMIVIRQF